MGSFLADNFVSCFPQPIGWKTRSVTTMKATITLDDKLFETASSLTGITDKSALVQEALTRLVRRITAQNLISLGGTEPNLEAVSRRLIGD